jgi:hypothetical protein
VHFYYFPHFVFELAVETLNQVKYKEIGFLGQKLTKNVTTNQKDRKLGKALLY